MTDFTRHLIAFTGKLGSGKDTAADRFQAITTLPVHRISFAKPLKASAAALFGIDPAEWEWMKNDPNVVITLAKLGEPGVDYGITYSAITARELLQRYGTEAHRDIFGDDFWVKQAFTAYDKFIGDATVWVCTDCRFPNEAEAVKARQGIIVRVVGVDEETGGHASEAGFDPAFIDYTIDNTVRGDDFYSLDSQLYALAGTLGIEVPTWV